MKSSDKDISSAHDRSLKRPKYHSKSKKRNFKPSMISSPCLRKIYYSYNRVPEDSEFPLPSARKTELGTAIGQMMAEDLLQAGVLIPFRKEDGTFYKNPDGSNDYEFRIHSEDLEIKMGKIDLTVVLKDGLWLGEIKSMNQRQFTLNKTVRGSDLIQGVTYLFIFNKMLKEGAFDHIEELKAFSQANGIRFLYYNKDQSTKKEFFVTLESATSVFTEIVKKLDQVKWYTTNDELPPPTEDWCQSCGYRDICAQNKKASEVTKK